MAFHTVVTAVWIAVSTVEMAVWIADQTVEKELGIRSYRKMRQWYWSMKPEK